jgi:hypothetical protein
MCYFVFKGTMLLIIVQANGAVGSGFAFAILIVLDHCFIDIGQLLVNRVTFRSRFYHRDLLCM